MCWDNKLLLLSEHLFWRLLFFFIRLHKPSMKSECIEFINSVLYREVRSVVSRLAARQSFCRMESVFTYIYDPLLCLAHLDRHHVAMSILQRTNRLCCVFSTFDCYGVAFCYACSTIWPWNNGYFSNPGIFISVISF